MNNLQVIYYFKKENNQVKALIQKKEFPNKEYTKLKLIEEQIDKSDFLEKEKQEAKFIINANYYVYLMQEGYSYEELFNLLKREQEIKVELGSLKTYYAILTEKNLLEFAYQEKETIVEYIANLLGNTIVEVVEKNGIYTKRLFNSLEKSKKNQIKSSTK